MLLFIHTTICRQTARAPENGNIKSIVRHICTEPQRRKTIQILADQIVHCTAPSSHSEMQISGISNSAIVAHFFCPATRSPACACARTEHTFIHRRMWATAQVCYFTALYTPRRRRVQMRRMCVLSRKKPPDADARERSARTLTIVSQI